jgi:hypothetical protein
MKQSRAVVLSGSSVELWYCHEAVWGCAVMKQSGAVGTVRNQTGAVGTVMKQVEINLDCLTLMKQIGTLSIVTKRQSSDGIFRIAKRWRYNYLGITVTT